MMLIFRHFMAVSAGLVIALGYGASATAQELPSLNKSQSDKESSNLLSNSSVASLSQEATEEFVTPTLEAHVPVAAENTPVSVSNPEKTFAVAQASEALAAESENSNPAADATAVPLVLPEVQSSLENDLDEFFNSEPLVVEIKQMNRESPPENEELSQSFPSEEFQSDPRIPKNPAPEDLNPSANPLLFPTKPDEVEVETVQPITLEQAIELALRNNKEFEVARITLLRSREELREAKAARWPTLDTIVEFRQQDPAQTRTSIQESLRLGFATRARSENTEVDGSVELNYDVYTGGRRGADIRRAERQVRFNQLDVERLAEETRFQATSDYYNLQNADAQVAIEQAAVEDATQSLRDAQLLEKAGLGTRFDVLQAEVDLANADQALTRAIADQRTARRQLAQTLSLGQHIELAAADEIQEAGVWPISLDESIVLAYKNRAELEQFLVQREIDEQQREIALSDIRPQVSFFANYEFFDDFNDAVAVENGYRVGARVQWRFFDGGRAFARADQSNRDIDRAETEFADQRNQIRLDVETAYFDLIANQENIGTAQKAVETATERLRLARLRFQAGVGTQTEVIDAQRDLTESRGNLLQAIIGYNQSLNALQRAVSNLPDKRLFELR